MGSFNLIVVVDDGGNMQLRTVTVSYCTPFAAIGVSMDKRRRKSMVDGRVESFNLSPIYLFNALLWSYIVVSDQLNP